MAEENPMTGAEYLPPWRDVKPDGQLGEQYGPKSPATWARHIAQFRNWAWRKPSQESVRPESIVIVAYMRDGGDIREDVPKREREVYRLIYEEGHSVRWVARHLQVKRETVRVYRRRLQDRAEAWACESS